MIYQKRIILAMSEIKENPFSHCKKLRGQYSPPHYRVCIGEYRVILLIDTQEKVLLIDSIGHRSNIYKRYGKI